MWLGEFASNGRGSGGDGYSLEWKGGTHSIGQSRNDGRDSKYGEAEIMETGQGEQECLMWLRSHNSISGHGVATPAQVVEGGGRVPEEWREMEMVMIPKTGKDHSKVKGWRPIVLANAVGKLAEKIIAGELQNDRSQAGGAGERWAV